MNIKQLCWLDLEMTGFNPKEDVITELAIVMTDLDFKPLAEYASGYLS